MRADLFDRVVGYSEAYTTASGETASITKWGTVIGLVHAAFWWAEIAPRHTSDEPVLVPLSDIHTTMPEVFA